VDTEHTENAPETSAPLVAPGYFDFLGKWQAVPWEQQRALFAAMGVAGESDLDVQRELERREDEQWCRRLPPVIVVTAGGLLVPLTVTAREAASEISWRVVTEGGDRFEGRCRPAQLPLIGERAVAGERFARHALALPAGIPLGYHRFELRSGVRRDSAPLIVAPARCYEPPVISEGRRVWGLSVQVYALRSARNWGLGDLTDLTGVVDIAADAGACFVGISPLHALFPDNPNGASPYSPSSRLFGNVLLLDVEAIADYVEADAAPTPAAGAERRERLEHLRRAEIIDYEAVAALKRPAFEGAFRRFAEYELAGSSPRARQFRAFQAEQGERLRLHCLFEAIQEGLHRESPSTWGWPDWPEDLRDPASSAARRFAAAHAGRMDFFAYLQWQFELQLAAVARHARARGLGIGLYRDLAVGFDSGGAEAWSSQQTYALKVRVGAPPDLYNSSGQNWGLPPPDPVALRAGAYAPFIDALRASMRHSGALRIDHAMALARLYWIPHGGSPRDGAYVAYPLDDLLGIVALESVRHRCLVIAEDLGTVPPRFSEALRARGVLSCRLLYFETHTDGRLRQPQDWRARALVAAATHDLPTLRGFWLGRDLAVRSALRLFDTPELAASMHRARAVQRRALLVALAGEQLLPPGTPTDPDAVPDFSAALATAVHRFLARTPAQLLSVQMEDVLEQIDQVNFPGTTSEHPNWRRRLPAPIEEWKSDERFRLLSTAMREEGRSAEVPALLEPARRAVRIPRATYRLQLHAGFNFAQARALVPYLARLGVSHCYFSPYLKARPGSTHGYDIVDHNRFNPEIGSREDFERLVEALRRAGMGQIMDIVPNHMGVLAGDNAWWLDVLENGEASAFARFFDIDWQPLREDLHGKVLLPILGDQYGRVLARGELKLAFDAAAGSFFLTYYQHRMPIDPHEYSRILGNGLETLRRSHGPSAVLAERLEELIQAFDALPARTDITERLTAIRRRAVEPNRRHLAEACAVTPGLLDWISRRLEVLNGRPDDPASFDALHGLIKAQAYRLAHWRVASDDINYRRFFEINDLAAVRMEDEVVFAATHRLIFELLQSGKVDGLRIDHPDGLYDPLRYFARLQQRGLPAGTGEGNGKALPAGDGEGNGKALPAGNGEGDGKARPAAAAEGNGKALPPVKQVYVLIEKIIAGYEDLADDWPVHGTTGYRFMNVLNGLFIDAGAEGRLERTYTAFIGERPDFQEICYQTRQLILEASLASELNVLAHRLSQISQMSRSTCDFTLNMLRSALAEVAACFPIYRTYVSERGATDDDRRYINWAVGAAAKRSRVPDLSVFDFVREALLTTLADEKSAAYRRRVVDFAMKYQQLTSPLMAKGIEDTALYRYNRLVSLNEVGGDPRTFGISLNAFHAASQDRYRRWRHTMLASSTHDNKRAEDVRARINVLSELPAEWRMHVHRWRRANRSKRSEALQAPSRDDEYLLYQTLVGSWPLRDPDEEGLDAYRARISSYMIKAVREAKRHSSWMRPDAGYERALEYFIDAILAAKKSNRFLADFVPFARRVSWFGMLNGLAQSVLKFGVPGVPDIYQGCELWDFSLVDPDNRRPVDFDRRDTLLTELEKEWDQARPALLRSLLADPADGRIKLFVTWRVLTARARHATLFEEGQYHPLRVTGSKAEHVCAFARKLEGASAAIVVVPRLMCKLLDGAEGLPVGEAVWGDTRVAIPPFADAAVATHAFTGESVVLAGGTEAAMPVGELLAAFPFALLLLDQR
jgi:(1->4)-alpha-D-glucan 1-alpha-D-glucosylmutase